MWAVEPSLFSYTGSSPLHFIDPYGLFLSWPTWEEYLAYLDFTDDSYEIDILPGGDYVVGGSLAVSGVAGTIAGGMVVAGVAGPALPGTGGWTLPGFGWTTAGGAAGAYASGLGTTAIVVGGAPIREGFWPAIVIKGRVYIAVHHGQIVEKFGESAIQGGYGMVVLDKCGRVVKWLGDGPIFGK